MKFRIILLVLLFLSPCLASGAQFEISPQASDTLWNQYDAQGLRHGFWRRQHRNGRRRYVAQFHHGVPVGVTTRYAPSGRVVSRTTFEDDGHTSHAVIYDERGRIAAEGAFWDTVKHGRWLYRAGQLVVREENWSHGLKHGLFMEYNDEGGPASEQRWQHGHLHGKQVLYHTNGRPRIVWEMRSGIEVGKTYTYYMNGKIRLEGQYRNGKRDGIWYFRNEKGEVEREEEYRGGKLIRESGVQNRDSALRTILEPDPRAREPRL